MMTPRSSSTVRMASCAAGIEALRCLTASASRSHSGPGVVRGCTGRGRIRSLRTRSVRTRPCATPGVEFSASPRLSGSVVQLHSKFLTSGVESVSLHFENGPREELQSII